MRVMSPPNNSPLVNCLMLSLLSFFFTVEVVNSRSLSSLKTSSIASKVLTKCYYIVVISAEIRRPPKPIDYAHFKYWHVI